jgi:hypothetical protein
MPAGALANAGETPGSEDRDLLYHKNTKTLAYL